MMFRSNTENGQCRQTRTCPRHSSVPKSTTVARYTSLEIHRSEPQWEWVVGLLRLLTRSQAEYTRVDTLTRYVYLLVDGSEEGVHVAHVRRKQPAVSWLRRQAQPSRPVGSRGCCAILPRLARGKECLSRRSLSTVAKRQIRRPETSTPREFHLAFSRKWFCPPGLEPRVFVEKVTLTVAIVRKFRSM